MARILPASTRLPEVSGCASRSLPSGCITMSHVAVVRIALNDGEWDMLRSRARRKSMTTREYVTLLANNSVKGMASILERAESNPHLLREAIEE